MDMMLTAKSPGALLKSRPGVAGGLRSDDLDSYVKEVCIPVSNDVERQQVEDKIVHDSFFQTTAGLYRSTSSLTAIRAFPTAKLAITLRLSDEHLSELLGDAAFKTFKIGSQNDQLFIVACNLLPFELRVTSIREDLSFHVEGSEAVLEGTIQDLQSKRVLFGGEDKPSATELHDDRINNGHCWSEVRELGKRAVLAPLYPNRKVI